MAELDMIAACFRFIDNRVAEKLQNSKMQQ